MTAGSRVSTDSPMGRQPHTECLACSPGLGHALKLERGLASPVGLVPGAACRYRSHHPVFWVSLLLQVDTGPDTPELAIFITQLFDMLCTGVVPPKLAQEGPPPEELLPKAHTRFAQAGHPLAMKPG